MFQQNSSTDGNAAPKSADYLVATANSTLTAERASAARQKAAAETVASMRKTQRRLDLAAKRVVNTSKQGLPVPIAYGRVFVGSAVVSAGLDTDQL